MRRELLAKTNKKRDKMNDRNYSTENEINKIVNSLRSLVVVKSYGFTAILCKAKDNKKKYVIFCVLYKIKMYVLLFFAPFFYLPYCNMDIHPRDSEMLCIWTWVDL